MSNIIKYEEVRMVESSEIDRVVEKIYQLPFTYQQQNIENDTKESFEYWIVPDDNNFPEGMPLEKWAKEEKPLTTSSKQDFIGSVYPDFQQILNELHRRGLMPEGKYIISI